MSVDDLPEPSKNIPLPDIISDAPEFDAPRFRFEEYAQSMADVIANPNNQTPLVLGLYGAWGTGKTTLMRRVEHYLRQRQNTAVYRTCKTVWFQAWKYAGEDAILAALIEEIFKTMRRDTLADSVKASMEEVMEKFKLEEMLGDVVKGLTGGVIDPGKWVAPMPHKDKLGFYDVFQESFDRLLWSYVTPTGLKIDGKFEDREGALVIFIDDLDRCPEPRIIQVLETIKLFMDKPGCVFVLGADREVIESALERRYGPKAAKKFMEKIVQVTFTLPPVPSDEVEAFLTDHVSEQKQKQDMMKKFAPMIARNLKHNIRAVKRFLNDLQFAESLAAHADVKLTEHPDALMRWSIVAYVRPDLANMIRDNVANLEALVKSIQALEEELRDGAGKLTQEIFEKKNIPDSLREWLQDPQVVELVRGFPDDLEVLKTLISFSAATESKEEAGEQDMLRKTPMAGLAEGRMVPVPSGTFLYGDEKKQENIDHDFEIDIYPVTNEQFLEFIEDGGYENKEERWDSKGWEWIKGEKITQPRFWDDPKRNKPDHPVVGVTWYEADAFARWAGKRLPTEQEWEKAARGTNGNIYPWGDDFVSGNCNSEEEGHGGTTPVTKYVNGRSLYHCYDMAGNVWEWTDSWSDDQATYRVLRGGSWDIDAIHLRSSFRLRNMPSNRYYNVGFRCARTPG